MPTNSTSPRVVDEIRAEMARQRKTGTELAEVLHLSQRSLSYRLTNTTRFDINELDTAAKWLGLKLSDLFLRVEAQDEKLAMTG